MSESESKESLTIARMGLYVAVISAVLAALTLVAPAIDRMINSGDSAPTTTTTASPGAHDALVEPPKPPTLPEATASNPMGQYASLDEGNVRNRTFEAALNGLPYVTQAPTEGAWLGKICAQDVIVTVNDDAPPDDLGSVAGAIAHASTIQVRPGDLWDSGPSANLQINPSSARRC